MDLGHLELAKRESKSTRFKDDEPCRGLAPLLSWLEKKPFTS